MPEDEKLCIYCAEVIKVEAIKCKHCGADLSIKPNEEYENKKTPQVASCQKCNVQLVTKEKKRTVTLGGLIGVLMFFIGIFAAFINILVGLLLVIAGLVIGSGGKKTVMVCPECGTEGRTI